MLKLPNTASISQKEDGNEKVDSSVSDDFRREREIDSQLALHLMIAKE
jgi:hypothetical protein